MGEVIYAFFIISRENTASVACSSYDRYWILAEAQHIADDFNTDIEILISQPDCEKPLARMCIYPRKAGIK